MSSILNCPACQQAVTLPPGRVALVQCPHCHNGIALEVQIAPQAAAIASRQPTANPSQRAPQIQTAPISGVANHGERPPQPNLLGQFVGIVGGGVLGVALGYWLLNYFGGPRYDFLHVPLPLVAHTQPTSPVADSAVPSHVAPADRRVEDHHSDHAVASAASTAPPFTAPPLTTPRLATFPNASQLPAAPATPTASLSQNADSTPDRPARMAVIPVVATSCVLAATTPPPHATPVEFPTYSAADLGESLAATQAVLGCPHCQGTGVVAAAYDDSTVESRPMRKNDRRVPCNYCDGKPSGRITSDVYARLCLLSQVLTFAEIDPAEQNFSDRKKAIEQVLLQASANQEKQDALGRLAGFTLTQEQRATSGVLLAGTVQSVDRQGRLYTTRLVLFGLPEVVTVVSASRPPLKPSDKAVIAGSIVDKPRDKLAAYEGTLPQIVWGGMPVKLRGDHP